MCRRRGVVLGFWRLLVLAFNTQRPRNDDVWQC